MLAKASMSNSSIPRLPARGRGRSPRWHNRSELGRADAGDESPGYGAGSPLVLLLRGCHARSVFSGGPKRRFAFRFTDLPRLKFAKVSEVPTPGCASSSICGNKASIRQRLNRVSGPDDGRAIWRLCATVELDVAQMFEPYASHGRERQVGAISSTPPAGADRPSIPRFSLPAWVSNAIAMPSSP